MSPGKPSKEEPSRWRHGGTKAMSSLGRSPIVLGVIVIGLLAILWGVMTAIDSQGKKKNLAYNAIGPAARGVMDTLEERAERTRWGDKALAADDADRAEFDGEMAGRLAKLEAAAASPEPVIAMQANFNLAAAHWGRQNYLRAEPRWQAERDKDLAACDSCLDKVLATPELNSRWRYLAVRFKAKVAEERQDWLAAADLWNKSRTEIKLDNTRFADSATPIFQEALCRYFAAKTPEEQAAVHGILEQEDVTKKPADIYMAPWQIDINNGQMDARDLDQRATELSKPARPAPPAPPAPAPKPEKTSNN
jgi:hypothetical protein